MQSAHLHLPFFLFAMAAEFAITITWDGSAFRGFPAGAGNPL
jgi:hypothetical protein